jgi:hypothetical protein
LLSARAYVIIGQILSITVFISQSGFCPLFFLSVNYKAVSARLFVTTEPSYPNVSNGWVFIEATKAGFPLKTCGNDVPYSLAE